MHNKITEGDLAKLLPSYRRWIAEGRPKYSGGYVPRGEPAQRYYDTYHDSIREEPDGTFSFNIQTFDSPEGDVWVRGKFTVDGETIRIVEHKAYNN